MLVLDIKPSRCLQVFLLAIHLCAAGAVMVAGIPAWIKILLALLLAVSVILGLRQQLTLKGRRSIQKAVWRPDGSWRIVTGYGYESSVLNWRSICSFPGLIIIQFETDIPDKCHMLLCTDSIGEELHRQLRVRLAQNSCQLSGKITS